MARKQTEEMGVRKEKDERMVVLGRKEECSKGGKYLKRPNRQKYKIIPISGGGEGDVLDPLPQHRTSSRPF